MYSTKAAIDNIMANGLAVPGTALKRMHVHERYMVMAMEAAKLRAHIATDCHEPETCGKTVCCDGVDDRNIVVDRLAAVVQTCATRSMSEAFKFTNVEEPATSEPSDWTDQHVQKQIKEVHQAGVMLGVVRRGVPDVGFLATNATALIDAAIYSVRDIDSGELNDNKFKVMGRVRHVLRINMENLMNAAVTEYNQNRHHQGEDNAA